MASISNDLGLGKIYKSFTRIFRAESPDLVVVLLPCGVCVCVCAVVIYVEY